MNKKAFLICVASLTSLLYGCGLSQRAEAQTQSSVSEPATNEVVTHGVTFKAGEGLTVPSKTGQILGLKIVDVEEGKATRRIELPLRVFQRGSSGQESFALASGSVATNQVLFLEPGTEVGILTSGKDSVTGRIQRVEYASAKVIGLAEVIVSLPASDQVQVGTFLDGSVTIPTQEDVVIIPKDALLKTAEGYFAYVVNGDSLFRTEIGVGAQEGEVVEVTDGLYAGDQVVRQPVMPLWLAELQAIRGGKACADGH